MSAPESIQMRLRLFGPFAAMSGQNELPGLRDHRKALQLLALLALHADKALSSEWVAAQLWPETGSLDSLGHTVPVLRKAMGHHGSRLIAKSGSLLLDACSVDLDTVRFLQAWESRSEDDAGLRAAVELYNGSLLQDWYEPWVAIHRAAFRDKYLEILQLMVRSACRQSDVPGARRFLRRLVAEGDLPADVQVVDYGIRGMHLAYDLLDGYGALVLVDVLRAGGSAGEVTVLEVGEKDLGSGDFDPHGMAPVAVLGTLHQLGGTLPRTYVVGCRPENVEDGIGLSDSVSAAVPGAVAAVRTLIADERLAG